jgi:hypothetical protein
MASEIIMKKPQLTTVGRQLGCKCLPFALAAAALVLTGCPNNQYVVELNPQGNFIERKLVFYCADGVNTNTGAPNYQAFDAQELAAITALYPPGALTNAGDRHEARAIFANELPDDVGGAGYYTNLSTSLGETGFYAERFRGNDDPAAVSDRRAKAAERLAELTIGWTQVELGHEPGYDKLRQFLDSNLRHDLENIGAYSWYQQFAQVNPTNGNADFVMRIGQYLLKRGYITIADIPTLLKNQVAGDSRPLSFWIRRFVARKIGVPENDRSLEFLSDDHDRMENSFDQYVAGSDLYGARLKQWEAEEKLQPGLKQPSAKDFVAEQIADLVVDSDMFGQKDHLVVRLTLPTAPNFTSGQWDQAAGQVVWDTDIVDRTNNAQLPVSCYASWSQPNERFQTEHLGKVALVGSDLMDYCLWRSSLTPVQSGEWDVFMAGLTPGPELIKSVDAFRFSEEPTTVATNADSKIPSPSAYPRELLKNALK